MQSHSDGAGRRAVLGHSDSHSWCNPSGRDTVARCSTGRRTLYPGYHPGSRLGSVVTGTLNAPVDGAVAGGCFGWLYNLLAPARSGTAN